MRVGAWWFSVAGLAKGQLVVYTSMAASGLWALLNDFVQLVTFV